MLWAAILLGGRGVWRGIAGRLVRDQAVLVANRDAHAVCDAGIVDAFIRGVESVAVG